MIVDEMVAHHELSQYWLAMRGVKTQFSWHSLSKLNRNPSSTVVPVCPHIVDSRHLRTCEICLSDVTWPFITHGSASVANVSQNCSVCGIVVCAICSPAGDRIPGNGINETITLADWRICVTEKGMTKPERVCVHCYLNAYNLR